MNERPDIADVLAETARTMNETHAVAATLEVIAQTVARCIPEMDQVGISLAHRDGRIETKAWTSDLVLKLDAIQYDLREGPCVYAMEAATVVTVEHAHLEERWPRYMPRAVDAGLRSQLAVKLFYDDRVLGALNMYSTTRDTIDPDSVRYAELLAAHAAIALGRSRVEEDLHTALGSRRTIGQAIGLVMGRYSIEEEQAFSSLVRASQTANIKLRDIAQEIVDQANELARGQVTDEPIRLERL